MLASLTSGGMTACCHGGCLHSLVCGKVSSVHILKVSKGSRTKHCCTIGGHLWNLAILAALNTSSFTTVSLVNHFNCQVQKPSSYPLKLFVRRCHHWQSLTGGGRATGMQISFVLESCWAARRPKWTGAHLLFLSLIVRYVSKNQGAKSPCGSAAAAAAASQEEEKMFQLWSPSLSSVHTESADHWSPVERLRS